MTRGDRRGFVILDQTKKVYSLSRFGGIKGKDRFRRGVTGLFDKISGKQRRLRLVNRKEAARLKCKQKESRQLRIFRHNQERSDLQKLFKQMHERQRQERSQLAGRIFEFRQIQDRNRERN